MDLRAPRSIGKVHWFCSQTPVISRTFSSSSDSVIYVIWFPFSIFSPHVLVLLPALTDPATSICNHFLPLTWASSSVQHLHFIPPSVYPCMTSSLPLLPCRFVVFVMPFLLVVLLYLVSDMPVHVTGISETCGSWGRIKINGHLRAVTNRTGFFVKKRKYIYCWKHFFVPILYMYLFSLLFCFILFGFLHWIRAVMWLQGVP